LTASESSSDIPTKRNVTAGKIALAGFEDRGEIVPGGVEPGIPEATKEHGAYPQREGGVAVLTGDVKELTIRAPPFEKEETFFGRRDTTTTRNLELIVLAVEPAGQ
jgi:hypothetical protein